MVEVNSSHGESGVFADAREIESFLELKVLIVDHSLFSSYLLVSTPYHQSEVEKMHASCRCGETKIAEGCGILRERLPKASSFKPKPESVGQRVQHLKSYAAFEQSIESNIKSPRIYSHDGFKHSDCSLLKT